MYNSQERIFATCENAPEKEFIYTSGVKGCGEEARLPPRVGRKQGDLPRSGEGTFLHY